MKNPFIIRRFLIIIAIVVASCGRNNNQRFCDNLTTESKNVIAEFAKAQKQGDTILPKSLLFDASISNHKMFCCLVDLAYYGNIIRYFETVGFANRVANGYNYSFRALSNLDHLSIIYLIDRIKHTHPLETILPEAITISGLLLTDSVERNLFVNKQILANSEIGASELHYLSILLKSQPNNTDFIEAFQSILTQCDSKTAYTFLKKCGYVDFNRFTDEYTEYYPEKISHLKPEIIENILKKAKIKT